MATHEITPCLWFDTQAEEAARFYVSLFESSSIDSIAYYGDVGKDVHGQPAGRVLSVEFRLEGRPYLAMNGGPHYRLNEAFSLQVHCETQAEIDRYWSALTEGGEESQCGWLKDRFGLSWQVMPAILPKMMMDPDRSKSERAMQAFMGMKKFDLAALVRAFEGR